MAIKYIRTAKIKNKTVIVRVGVDVPLTADGKVADDFRLHALLPTIHLLRAQNCKILLCGHIGRPDGKTLPEFSLRPVAEHLAKLLKLAYGESDHGSRYKDAASLLFFPGDIRKESERIRVRAASSHAIVFLENLRFYPEEQAGSTFFAKQLASLADVYVDEAFSVAHRKDASIVAIAKYLPSYAGLQLEQEITNLDRVLKRPKAPFVVMMGGAKISDKIKTLTNLGKKADTLLVGGGLANLFFAARGYEIGKSKAEHESVKLAWQTDKNFKGKIVLPVDVVVANSALDKSSIRTCAPHEVKKNELILDSGPKTILAFAKVLKEAKTVVWNGPLGFFEHKPFHHSTMALGRIVGAVGKGRAYAVVGGGETVDAIRQAGQAEYVDHLSTGGGAMLEYLAGTKLPGITALEK